MSRRRVRALRVVSAGLPVEVAVTQQFAGDRVVCIAAFELQADVVQRTVNRSLARSTLRVRGRRDEGDVEWE